MKPSSRWYLLRPYLVADSLIWVFLIPSMVAILNNIIPELKHQILTVVLVLGVTGVIHLSLALLVRIYYMRPVMAFMDDEATDDATINRALRLASRFPLMDVLFFYVIRALIICLPPMMGLLVFMGKISAIEAVSSGIIVALIVMTSLPYWYLACEHNLAPFYAKIGRHQGFAKREGILNFSMSNKIFLSILLTSVPTAICYIVVILYTDYAHIPRQGTYLGLTLLVAQSFILSFLNARLLTRSFTHSVGNMTNMLTDMAGGQGDLTMRLQVYGIDEVGRLAFFFNEFVGNLEGLVAQVKASTQQMIVTINEVSAGSQGISESSQEQASSIQQVAATIDEMHTSVNMAVDLVHEGREASTRLIKMVEEEYSDIKDLTNNIQEISRDSQKISDVVSTVKEVAFQINLLALNAAVEAAHAGEHGKGFAVVASEVRSLAVRSAEASHEINSLISNTVERITRGNVMMQKAMTRFEGLKDMIDSVSSAMESVSSSADRQQTAISEIQHAVTHIDDATQQNASTIEELASVAGVMNDEAQVLTTNMERFKVSEEAKQ